MKRQYILALMLLFLAALPYGIAWLATPGDAYFSGLLFNPQDGFTYLAKMRQGWEGSWTFDLTYSARPAAGAPIFLFYLLLGHAARFFHLPLILVFHSARLIDTAFLIWSFDRFLRRGLGLDEDLSIRMLLLGSLGAGLGWVGLAAGRLAPDLWVAEAYPFLSTFANPHFPLGLGLMLMIFTEREVPGNRFRDGILLPAGAATALAIVLPFGFAAAAVVEGIKTVWGALEKRKTDITKNAAIFLPGGILLVWQYSTILGDPLLSQWNAQNLTPTPEFLDLVIGFSPALLLALAGVITLFRKRDFDRYRIVLSWAAGCLLLAVIPFGLQRRFLTGLFIPLSILAIVGLDTLAQRLPFLKKLAFLVVFLLSLPSNLVTLAVFTGAGMSRDPLITIPAAEKAGLDWMAEHLSGRPVCLSDARTGLMLPAYTPCRVYYGHPFESVPAQKQKQAVDEFFSSESDAFKKRSFLKANPVNYLILNGEEKQAKLPEEMLIKVFENQALTIYEVQP